MWGSGPNVIHGCLGPQLNRGRKFGEMPPNGYFVIQILPNSISADDPLVGWGGRYSISIHHLSRPTCLTTFQNFLPKLKLIDLQFVTAFKLDNIAMTSYAVGH